MKIYSIIYLVNLCTYFRFDYEYNSLKVEYLPTLSQNLQLSKQMHKLCEHNTILS